MSRRGEQKGGWRDDISAESVTSQSPHSPSLFSPPSHTSPLLLRQQHHPVCVSHCLGLVVLLCGVFVCVCFYVAQEAVISLFCLTQSSVPHLLSPFILFFIIFPVNAFYLSSQFLSLLHLLVQGLFIFLAVLLS